MTDDTMKNDVLKKQEELINERRKHLKSGDNVIHLEYLEGYISEENIDDYDNKLKSIGLELSKFNKSGIMYNCLDNYSLMIYFLVTQPLIGEFIKGIATNASWDMIKYILKTSLNNVKGKSYYRMTSNETVKKELKFGLKVKLDKNTCFDFELKGDIDDTTIQNSLDKILVFLREQELNKNYKTTDYVYFDSKKNDWVKIDVDKELLKMVEKREIDKK